MSINVHFNNIFLPLIVIFGYGIVEYGNSQFFGGSYANIHYI